MCGGVTYFHKNQEYRAYFPNPKAMLPVVKRSGSHELVAWGRRKQQGGILPLGGWARHDSILAGRWDKYFPKPVRIAVDMYMEKDHEGKSIWYDLVDSKYLHGLLARDGNILRVYVVTIDARFDQVHDRMPKVVSYYE